MPRQYATPVLIEPGQIGTRLRSLALASGADAVSEAQIQSLIQNHPECLPITEIDPVFADPVPICTELSTPAGPIDNFMVTASGLPVLAECKLWRNPEGRREVVGQILDYAKELSRWSSSDLQREVGRNLKREGNAVLDLVRAARDDIDEIEFNDSLTMNLRRGRFLLLIVGDGIREGVEAITEYLQVHAGLHFTLGLVELPIFMMPGGSMLVTPRVLARTVNVVRNVIAAPEGLTVEEAGSGSEDDGGTELSPLKEDQQRFWTEFLAELMLDDPEQSAPKPSRLGYLSFMLPAPSGSSWITVYRDVKYKEAGLFLSCSRATPGEAAMIAIADDWEVVREELGGSPELEDNKGRPRIIERRATGSFEDPTARLEALSWLRERLNTWVNVLRPRVRSAVADLGL